MDDLLPSSFAILSDLFHISNADAVCIAPSDRTEQRGEETRLCVHVATSNPMTWPVQTTPSTHWLERIIENHSAIYTAELEASVPSK